MPGTNCTPHQFSIDQVQKHSETALDTPRKEGTESSFPIKMHLIVLHKAFLSVKSRGFTDDLKKPVLIAYSAVQLWGKKIEKTLVESTLRGFVVPGAGMKIEICGKSMNLDLCV